MKKIIVMIKGDRVETWGSFTNLCKAHGFPYFSMKMLKFPMDRDGWTILKINHNQKST